MITRPPETYRTCTPVPYPTHVRSFGRGEIGRRVARRARPFGMDIAYHNRRAVPGEEARFHTDPRSRIADSDVLLLAWPSTIETREFISAGTLALARRNLSVVNIGRGDRKRVV